MAETENHNSPKPRNEEPQTKHTEEEDKHKTDNEDRGGEKLVHLPDNSVRSLSCIVVPDRSFGTHSETLAFSSLTPSANDHDSDCHSFSELLAGAMASPTKISPEIVNKQSVSMVDLPPALDPARFKGQFGMSHQEALASVTAQAVQAQAQKQLQAGSLEIVPVYLAQPVSSAMMPTLLKQEIPLMSQEHSICTPELVQKDSSNPKMNPANLVKETPSSDGYSWRKYGQKQVKNNESSRSYYKCTDSSCHAKKKVQSCDNSGCVTEIIYKGQHNHEPPQKIRSTKAGGSISSACPIVCTDSGRGNGVIECPVEKFNSLAPSISKEEPRHATSEEILLITNESGTDAGVRNEEEQGDEPQPKRRMKNNKVASLAPKIKTIKDHKVVVQAVGDVGISGDGYRWRKYGQKMVKGNPNPRSYYRCTSNGCPVRKHVEKAIDDAAGIIITYEGKHDHDMPVPKKRNGPPSSALHIVPAAAINGEPLKTSEILSDQKGSSQFSTEKEGESTGEKAIELVGEKALESARTLLSIGIELKPC